jgi:hypothetical protein
MTSVDVREAWRRVRMVSGRVVVKDAMVLILVWVVGYVVSLLLRGGMVLVKDGFRRGMFARSRPGQKGRVDMV